MGQTRAKAKESEGQVKTGYRLTITLHKTKLKKNPNGDKRYDTDYVQVSEEEITAITFATCKTEADGRLEFKIAKEAVERLHA